MTEQEFMQQTRERLETLRSEQRRMQERLATELRRLNGLRPGLSILVGGLALGLGLSVGYQIGRR